MTDLIDAATTATPALPAGLRGLLNDVPSDECPTAEVPVIAAGPAALPPPTMQTLAQPVLPPPPSAIPTTAPLPVAATSPDVVSPEVASPVSAGPAPTPTPELTPAPAATPALVTGPAAILSADPVFAPLEQTIPALPAAAAVAPANTAAAAVSSGPAAPLTLEDLLGQQNPAKGKKKKQGASFGRVIGRLVLFVLLAAGGYAAYEYGPGLYEEYTADGEVTEGAPSEVDAPLAFPNATPASTPIRTAEFVLEGLPGAPDMTYHVTTDFETNVSQVDVTRPNGPDLQILTYGEAALIRRTDDDQWYQLERGRFPLDDRLERADWVRQLDELLPTAIRSSITIDDAGETTVEGVPTRRLSLSLDVALLGGTVAEPSASDLTTPAEPVDPTVAVDAAVPADPTDPLADALPAPPIEPAPPASGDQDVDATRSLTTSIEVWVDAQGLVRKVSGIPQLGAETITVIRTDSAAWVPEYPSPEYVQPLTAATLVVLGI